MNVALAIIVACACATALASMAVVLSQRATNQQTRKIIETQMDFNTRLLSRYCASMNIQAEAFVRQQENKTTNEDRRLEDAGIEQKTEWIR